MLKRGRYCLMKRLLGEQRLGLAADDDALDRGDLGGHRGVAAGAEVRGDALADRDRLADVDHAAGAVAEQVDAGLVGQLAPLLGEVRPAEPLRVRAQYRCQLR